MLINRLVTKYCYDIWYLLFPRVQDGGNSLKAHLVTDSLQLNKLTTLMQRNLTGESFLTTRSFFHFFFSLSVWLIPSFYQTVISTHCALIAVNDLEDHEQEPQNKT